MPKSTQNASLFLKKKLLQSENETPTFFSKNFDVYKCLQGCKSDPTPEIQGRCQDYCTTRNNLENSQPHLQESTLHEINSKLSDVVNNLHTETAKLLIIADEIDNYNSMNF